MTTRLTILLLLGTMLSTSAPAQKKMTTYDSLREQLYVIDNNDEIYRNQMDNTIRQYGGDSKEMKALLKKMSKADSVNLLQVTAIIEKYGWLGPDQVGSEGSGTLFMVIQHADKKTRKKYLPLMQEAVTNGKAKPAELALLEDRVALEEGRRQRYGSQIGWNVKTNTYVLAPLEDPDSVDQWRAARGLGPLADYLKENFKLVWDVEKYKKENPPPPPNSSPRH